MHIPDLETAAVQQLEGRTIGPLMASQDQQANYGKKVRLPLALIATGRYQGAAAAACL